MSLELVVFDLDGTLLDTVADLAHAVNHVLSRHGYESRTLDEIGTFVGRGAASLMRQSLPSSVSAGPELVEQLAVEFINYYDYHANVRTKPFDSITEMLRTMHSNNVKNAVLSNKPHGATVWLSGYYFPGLISHALGQRKGVPKKPDPAGLLEMLRHFSVGADQCIYVGDSGIDMETGRNAGVRTIGVTWGFRTKNELIKTGADIIVDKTDELTKKLIDFL